MGRGMPKLPRMGMPPMHKPRKPPGTGQKFLGPPTPAPVHGVGGQAPGVMPMQPGGGSGLPPVKPVGSGFTGGFTPPGNPPMNIPMGPPPGTPGFPRRRR